MHNRQLLNELRALGKVHTPARVLEAILDEVELSDHYASLETALGPVFVAWNRQGVSAVMKTATPEEFETRFRERFRRSPRPALEIPRGEIRTYGWIAAQIGHPLAVRAVGSALRKNPVPVLIPCHRVVRSDGQVGEYALGGSDAKRRILAAEGIGSDDIPRLARRWRSLQDGKLVANG